MTENHVITGANGVNQTTRYTYDHQGRKKYTSLQLDGGTEITVSESHYDHKNQLTKKGLGRYATSGGYQYLQEVDYSFNAQGWLTGINNLSTQLLVARDYCVNNYRQAASTSFSNGDLFALAIDYNTTLPCSGVPAAQNGNITSLKWWHVNQYNQTYSYKYDHLNRVTDAIHGEIAGTTYSVKNHFNEKFQYDSRGNILKLDRQGLVPRQDIAELCYKPITIDSLQYIYATGTNKLTQVVDHAPCPDMIQLPQDIDRDITYAANQEIWVEKPRCIVVYR
ncbi:MAG: hypothetical protein IPO37_18805 [Saprospiraceae bacterium]|nr:hypothetical protein [Saprospiraceae bacterium]